MPTAYDFGKNGAIHELPDNRTMAEFQEMGKYTLWIERRSIRKWRYCKYCYKETPCFILKQGFVGSLKVFETLLCCWECGYGLDAVYKIPDNMRDAYWKEVEDGKKERR